MGSVVALTSATSRWLSPFIVQEGALHQHEEAAEQFAWASAATLGLAALVMVLPRSTTVRAATVAVVLATVVVAGLGLRVGHAGGELVYVHGAASAYTDAGSPVSPARSSPPPGNGDMAGDDTRTH